MRKRLPLGSLFHLGALIDGKGFPVVVRRSAQAADSQQGNEIARMAMDLSLLVPRAGLAWGQGGPSGRIPLG